MTFPNPYEPTEVPLEEGGRHTEVTRPVGLLMTASVQAAVALLLAARAPATLASFREMFQGFGADLPARTRFLLDHPHVWWLFGAAGVAIAGWLFLRARVAPRELLRMRIAVRAFTVALATAIAFAVWSLYAPIFELGQAV